MIATLVGWGLSARAAKIVAYVAVPLLILAVVWGGIWLIRRDAYNDGHEAADREWREASDRLIEKSQNAATKADQKAATRAADFAAKQEDEKEKIHEALEQGDSPFDALFPSE